MPSKGICQTKPDPLFDNLPNHVIAWDLGGETLVKDNIQKQTYKTDSLFLRPHGEYWNLNAFYINMFGNLTELVAFEVDNDFRLLWVTYATAQDGTRVLDATSGFKDATCTLF